jgi:hypothetical protein
MPEILLESFAEIIAGRGAAKQIEPRIEAWPAADGPPRNPRAAPPHFLFTLAGEGDAAQIKAHRPLSSIDQILVSPRERLALSQLSGFPSRCTHNAKQREDNMLGTILIVLLILMLIGALPTWPHSRSWGYYPTGGIGLIVVIVVILLLLGRI